ncbi:MAG: hypothetical protein BEN18_05490 [Epulopiscium sp. Nuni2H_MBin001]|nr:MAG: hypothetical protein BEN18_05490 [Epulopiscium sp. Nuni2H_MBin001]
MYRNYVLMLMMVISVVFGVPVTYAAQGVTIRALSYEPLVNNQDFEVELSVDNSTGETVYLITALYNEETGEMVTYNYVSTSDSLTWGSCLAIPEEGEFKVKVFAWDSMDNMTLVSNVIEIGDNVPQTVTFSIEKRTIGKGDVLAPTEFTIDTDESVWDLLVRISDIELDYSMSEWGVYLTGVDGDYAGDFGSASGWMYDVNGESPSVGMMDYKMVSGDVIRLCYTLSWEDAISEPLVNVLQRYVDYANEISADEYSASSYNELKATVALAQLIIDDEAYNSTQASVEYEVSEYIAQIITALENLSPKVDIEYVTEVPADFYNNISLNTDFVEIALEGGSHQIYPRRLDEIINNSISNQVTNPDFNYEVLYGNSVIVDDAGLVSPISYGTSIVGVTYDAVTANGNDYGDISAINTGLVVVNVTDGVSTGVTVTVQAPDHTGWNEIVTSYDTFYYTGDYYDFTFGVGHDSFGSITSVKVNGEELERVSNRYNAKLHNGGNIVEVEVTYRDEVTYFAQVVDARKIEIIVENLTDASRHDDIRVGDTVNVSFNGITPAVYKLATIYNPSFAFSSASDEDKYEAGSKVIYTNSQLGGEVLGKETQYYIAEVGYNDITFEATEAGTYNFTQGHIQQGWWGSELGTDKIVVGQQDANLSADHHVDKFSVMPSFSITVSPNVSTMTTTSSAIVIE